MIDIDTKDTKQFVKNLESVSRGAYPLAVRATIDRQAFETSNEIKKNVLSKKFTLRSKYIQKTVGYKKSERVFEIPAMESFAGQMDMFAGKKINQLELQETGKPVVAKGKYTKAPTQTARGGNFNKKVRKAALFNLLKQNKIQTIKDVAMNPSKFELNQAVAVANRQNKEFTIISSTQKGVKGIFKVNKKGVKLLYKFTDKANRIKKTEWLKPTAEKIIRNSEKYFVEEAEKRIAKALGKNLKQT